MSAPKFPSRRQFLFLASLLGGVKAFAAEKEKGSGDNGIGGTGYRPGDNGIGGTGFIGTIRKFGSVYINGQRITYPADAAIEIDGSPVEARDMRIGQVARLVADRRDETWTTQRIVIVSEVVGPVERIGGKSLDVLGQRVQLPNAGIARLLKIGDRIAISGLRRPDQTIVASAVERREGGLDQIAGVLSRDAAGELRIGGQKVASVGEDLAGQRIVARGALDNGVFVARETRMESDIGIGGARNVSIETWVSRRGGALATAEGVPIEDRAGAVQPGIHHVVINGEIGTDGRLIARQMEFINRRGDFDPSGGGPGGGRPGGGGPNGGGPGGGFGGPGGPGHAPGSGSPGGGIPGGSLPGGGRPGGTGGPGGALPGGGNGLGGLGGGAPHGGITGGGIPGGNNGPTWLGGGNSGGDLGGAVPGGGGLSGPPGGLGAPPGGLVGPPGGLGAPPGGGPGGFVGPPGGGRFH